jgi:hypothetical protein
MRKLKREEFIQKSKLIHGDKYDYSEVEYVNSSTKVKIIFDKVVYTQSPNKHLMGRCPEKDTHSSNTIDFIKKSKLVHGDKYDYSLVDYKNNKSKVKIIYNGVIYEQSPYNHLIGCPESLNTRKISEKFIEESKLVHGDKYDYSLVDYKNNRSKVKIIYNGVIYEQSPQKHLMGSCPEESNQLMTTEDFIKRSIKIHNDKYDYSLVDYKGYGKEVKIVYNGVIYNQLASTHLSGYKPELRNIRKSKEEFLEESNKIHNNKYDYTLVEYKNNKIKIKIICKDHGIFEQVPTSHLRGDGCLKCNKSKGNNRILEYLNENNIEFIEEKTFIDCVNKKKLPFDFYLPHKNILIEFDGKQHYEPIKYFGGDISFEYRKINDMIKTDYAIKNNIKLIRIPYTKYNKIFTILKKSIK